MAYYGSWKLNDTLTFVVNTHNPTNGMATAADAVPTYHVYEDETASPIITGSMATLNSPNALGFYSEQITLSAANGFEKGRSYNIYIRAVVASVTGTTAHNFQMEAEVDANTVSVPVTAGSVTGSVLGNVNGSVASVVGNVGGNVVGSVGSVVGSVGSVTAPVTAGNVTGSVLGNVNGSVGSVVGAVGSVTNPVTVGTNNDKTGYSLSSPQSFNLIGNVSGTITNVLNVVNPVVAGVVTGSVLGNVNGSVGSVVAPVGISTGTFLDALADKVWDEAIAGHLAAGSVGNALNAAGAAGDPWSTPLPGSYTSGQAGHILASRMPTGTVLVGDKTGFSLSSPQNFNLIGNISGTLSNVNSVVNPVTVGTNNDKTGYSLSSPQSVNIIGNISGTITNVLNVVNPVVAGVVTGSVLGNVNGSVGSVVAPVGISTGTFLEALADKVWDEATSGHQTAGTTGKALTDAGSAGDPWATSLPGSYVAGQAGHILASRMPTGTVLVGDKTGFSLSSSQNFDNLGTLANVTNVINPVVAGVVTGSVLGNVNGSVNSVTQPVGISTGSFINAIADQVWDEALAGHLQAGSAGSALNGAGSAGDPWTTPLPGAYGAGTAGHILASRMPTGTVVVGTNQDKTGYSLSNPQSWDLIGNITGTITNVVNVVNPVGLVTGTYISNLALLDVAVSTRSSQTSVDALDDYVDTEVAAIKAKTDNLPANPAAVSDIPTANQNADALLKRDWTAVTGEAARSVLNALRFIRNKFSTTASPGSVTVYKEDDTTVAYTKSVTTDASADPIVEG
jgi:mannose/fructose/N-acetylgalactosamine-specific phosphotransferase system component IIC